MSGGSPPEGTVTFLFSDIERSTEPGVADRSVAAVRDLDEHTVPDFDGPVRFYEPARPGTP